MFRALVAAAAAIASIASIPSVLAVPAVQQLVKRTSGRATYFAVGLGSCGNFNVPSDFIVAINEYQSDGGAHCGQGITISYGGKTAHATVMDLCPFGYCNYGDLDLSEGLFTFFEPTSAGVFQMEWWFDGQGPSTGGGYTPPAPQPDPTTPSPTPEAPTPTYTPPTSSETSSSSSSSSSSESFSAAAAPSSSDAPAPQWDPSTGSVPAMNKAAMNLANLIYAAHNT